MTDKNCGCNHEHDHECGCGHNHNEECGCGHEPMFVDLQDENGEIIKCEIIEGFELKGKEYAVLVSPDDENYYIFKVEGDEEVGELVVPSDEEFEEASNFYERILEEREI
ncbi:DUF1292 domain-containing protein [Oceanirhabdus sp. W0125-5]|uniref:DUF1292 domain-containing protein n=1 Tax=Oceanirhabdus sp. W0125-5 TaxID=2999116 RepID=UPI0022F309C6|nr:DUF1292 domain-containing protein [Oceanirhabdus sp. W0125-5]WBW95488.1 DUF1292 domain-containing protein [Oceanirhabdus sp. W0125-5]